MSTLDRALDLLTPGRVLEGLAAHFGQPAPRLEGSAREGVTCDMRPGSEEKDPSLSYKAGDRGPVFRRFGADDFEGGAVAFLESAGIPKGDAARLLIEWAGLEDEKPAGQKGKGRKGKARRGPQKGQGSPAKEEAGKDPARRAPKHVGLSAALEKLAQFAPLTPEDLAYRLRGLRPLEDPADPSEAAQEVTRRGLWPAVRSGTLRAYALEDGARLPAHSLPGALFFEVRGPDGAAWAVKFRNTDAALEAAEAKTGKRPTRYAYAGKGSGRPAWCARPMREDLPTVFVEGELNAAAVFVMLEAAGFGDAYNVQGVASVGALPHLAHLRAGSAVYVFADMGDKRGEGDSAREVWGTLCAHAGAAVFQLGQTRAGEANPFAFQTALGDWKTGADACDALGHVPPFSSPEAHAAYLGQKLRAALEEAKPYAPAPEAPADRASGEGKTGDGSGVLWVSDSDGFAVSGGKLCGVKLKRGEREDFEDFEELLNFSAFIAAEVTQEDGTGEPSKVFEIEGTRADGRPLPRLSIPSGEFMGMGWPAAKWGAGAIVRSGNGKKDRAREGIQRLSEARGITERTVYQFTGWIDTPEGPAYLTAGAAIGARGAVEGLEVDLSAGQPSGRLEGYALPDPAKAEAEDLRAAVRASLDLLDLVGLDPVSVPVLGAVFRAPLGRADFVVWLSGETGRNKTAFLALAQAHYGAGWHGEHLPDGWNSSPNALEKAAFTVKDALFLIDDFKPAGGAGEVAKMHGAASRVLQGAADGAGRGTLTADRRARAGLYPRGLVMSSGESLPRGHSNRARAVIVDVTRPLIGKDPAKSEGFYAAADRAASGVYALACAAYLQGLAGNLEALRVGSEAHRGHVRQWARVFEGAHGRTGRALAELSYGWACFLAFAVRLEAVTEAHALTLWGRVVDALAYTSEGQAEHLRGEDPVSRALSLTASLLAQGRVYLADLKSGEAPGPDPETALLCGWQTRPTYGDREGGEGADGALLTLRPGAVKVGYYSKTGGDEWAHFDPDALHEQLQRAASGQAGAALPDAGALWANMRDRWHASGLMRCQVEGQRVRSFWKVSTPDGTRRQLLTLRLPFDLPGYGVAGTVGTAGTDGEEKTCDTGFLPVPITLFFKEGLGTVGTVKTAPASSSPDLPHAGPLEDLEDLPDLEDSADLEDWGEV